MRVQVAMLATEIFASLAREVSVILQQLGAFTAVAIEAAAVLSSEHVMRANNVVRVVLAMRMWSVDTVDVAIR